jgi:hypothetical protein
MMRSSVLRRLVMSMVAVCFMAISFSSFAGVFVSVGIAPPPLPIYAQPVMPGDGYIWTPGYWAYGGGGYFWVPGTWVLAPYVGALWTPGYWGWNNGFYVFNAGYWGPHVGFYGGINYGYGYDGAGYRGGYWDHGRFNYNRNVGYNNGGGRVSYNGGRGGLMARPTPQDQLATRDRHTQPLAAQQQQIRMASQNRALRASVNHGAPSIAATSRPGAFNGNGVVGARGATTRTMNTASARTSMATSTNRMNGRSTSRATVNAGRSASNVPRNGNVQRSMQTGRASSYARPTRSAGGYQGATRPAASAYRPAARPSQQARPQAHAQPARGGGDRERH